jgi:glutaredoxin
MKKIVLILALIFLPNIVLAQTEAKSVELWFFRQDGCEYCAKAQIFLQTLQTEFPNLIIRDYEVSQDSGNAAVFSLIIDAYGVSDVGVPSFFVGDNFVDGYNDLIANNIRQMVERCSVVDCFSPSEILRNYTPSLDTDKEAGLSWTWIMGIAFVVIMLIAIVAPQKKKMSDDPNSNLNKIE